MGVAGGSTVAPALSTGGGSSESHTEALSLEEVLALQLANLHRARVLLHASALRTAALEAEAARQEAELARDAAHFLPGACGSDPGQPSRTR
mmetsp:Transcript_131287/g.365933  ORF Transcript_131287/g.365933 Transcript_131287/m.365933 type:complete len:92 (-) Transcript_131287:266-541(-)